MSFAIVPKFFAGVLCCGVFAYCKDQRNQKVDKLKLNLMYAEDAFKHVAIFSDNPQPEQHREIEQRIQDEIKPYDLEDKTTEIIAAIAKKYQRGNCKEQAAVAYVYLKNEKNLQKVEYHAEGEHGLVIIGKDPSTVIYEPCKKNYCASKKIPLKGKEAAIREWIDECKKKEGFEEFALALFSTGRGEEQLYENCLRDHIARKSKPRQLPKLSKDQIKKVENIYASIRRASE